MAKHKVVKEEKDETGEKRQVNSEGEFTLPLHVILVLALIATTFIWAAFPGDITFWIFVIAAGVSTVLLLWVSVADFMDCSKNINNLVSFFIGILLLILLFSMHDILLSILFSSYLVLSMLFIGKVMKLQTAIIIAIAITAIMFRVNPALPGSGASAGHLLSMDDPYYHYKYTDDLYTMGDIQAVDYRIYPPDGRPAPHYFLYYYNVYFALLTGIPLHHILLLSIVLMSAFGAVMLYFLLKELTGDWKSGAIAGFLFATLPAVLSKSVAGETEYTPVGLILGIFAIYLLVRAIKSEGPKGIKFAVLAGIAFFLLYITWGGSQMIYVLPLLGISMYLYISALFEQDNWVIIRNVFITVLTFNIIRPILLGSFTLDIIWVAASALPVIIGLWSESIRTRLPATSVTRTLIAVGFLGIILALYGMFWESYPPSVTLEVLAGVAIAFGVMVLTVIMTIISKGLSTTRVKLSNLEDSIRGNLLPICVVLIILTLAFTLYVGPGKIAKIPQLIYAAASGQATQNFLVQKTIAEQGAFATGDWSQKLCAGAGTYGAGELLSLSMAFGGLALVAYYLLIARKKERALMLLLPYLIGSMFFLFLMKFVWVQARLTFSVSLGFILLGAMAGILLPKNLKELASLRIIPAILLMFLLLFFTFYSGVQCDNGPNTTPSQYGSAWANAKYTTSSIDEAWFLGVKWLDKNIKPGIFTSTGYINGDYVLTWWDYGHFITALSRSTVIADPLQADEGYIMQTARFFYNFTTEDDAVSWLMDQPWNKKNASGEYPTKYIILDYQLVPKASALAFLGTNYYQYPNGHTAVNGVCDTGEICQNVETGAIADFDGTAYTCKQGIVCPRDDLTRVQTRMCCEASPTQCCNQTLDWDVAGTLNGTAKIIRAAGEPVYGMYSDQVPVGYTVCGNRLYSSSDTAEPVYVENGQIKNIAKRRLFQGSGDVTFSDGKAYPYMLVLFYSDGNTSVRLISQDCNAVDIGQVLANTTDNFVFGGKAAYNVHIPTQWQKNMFTRLYLYDGAGLKYFEMEKTPDLMASNVYPMIKIFKINYPSEKPVTRAGAAKDGDVVDVDYTLRHENGTMIESSVGKTPFRFTLGSGQVLSAFDGAVNGMLVNESKNFTIPAGEGYTTGPLANQTLVFVIKLLDINPSVSTPSPTSTGPLNMTFDRYDKKLVAAYNITKYPTVVFDCNIIQNGPVVDSNSELETLIGLTCIADKAKPAALCSSAGVAFNETSGKAVVSNRVLGTALNYVNKLDGVPSCGKDNLTNIYAFYSKDCSSCASEKGVLDSVAGAFEGAVNVTYYCGGDDAYCRAHSTRVVS